MDFKTFKPAKPLFQSLCAVTVASLVTLQPAPVKANDGIKGLAIGVGLGVIVNEIAKGNKKKNKKKVYKKAPTTKKKKVATGPRATIGTFKTTRSEVKDYQTRLNMLGFNTGTPDGVAGKNTRTGVSAFQQSIGAQPTGRLTEAEAARLKAMTGTPTQPATTATTQMASTGGQVQQPGNAFALAATQQPANQQVVNSAIPLPLVVQGGTQQQTALAAPAGDSTVTLEVFSLDTAPTGLGIAQQQSNFDILQVRTGDSLDAAKYTLQTQSVSNCATSGQITTCSMDGNPNDVFAIRALPDALGVPRITTLARHISFTEMQPESHLLSILPAQYDPLVQADDKVIGTEGCTTSVGPTGYSGAKIFEASVHSEPAELNQLAASCVSFARLSMTGPEPGLVDNLYIVLFDGSALPKEKKTEGLAKIKF